MILSPINLYAWSGFYDIHQERIAQERLKLTARVFFEQAAEGIFILDENLRYIES